MFHDGGVRGGVALVGADKSTGAQETKAGGRDIPRGDLVLPWVPSTYAAAHGAGCGEGVGLPKAATVGEKTRCRASGMFHPCLAQAATWGLLWG